MSKYRYTKEQKKKMRRFHDMGIRIFAGVLFFGFVTGLLFFFRPSVSQAEKRQLTEFPKFTISSFLDGSFFSQVSLWYSDTYPMRDRLVSLDRKWKTAYGISTSSMMIGGHEQADEIPDSVQPQQDGETPAEEKTDTQPAENTPATETVTKPEPEKPAAQVPDSKQMEAEIQDQIQQGLYVKNGAAYSIYYYSQAACQIYTDALNKAAEKLKGTTNVYSILVPNNSGVVLSEEELDKLGGSNQTQAISYYYSLYNGVTGIPTIETLREHNSEYLYFRTDHHWTQTAAYYVYRNFCEAKGIQPHELSQFQTMEFSPFLGTFYTALGNADMAANPDSVTAYVPMGTNDMVFWNEDGSRQDWNVITDVSSWDESTGYYCFVGGDKPLALIENPNITDGSSCLVLKESYGNCFIPFLVDHYQTVYIIDFRYSDVNVADYVKEHNIQDLIVMNNISIIASESVAEAIAGLL